MRGNDTKPAAMFSYELRFLIDWGRQHPDSVRRWPGSALFARIQHVFEDGVIDEQERAVSRIS